MPDAICLYPGVSCLQSWRVLFWKLKAYVPKFHRSFGTGANEMRVYQGQLSGHFRLVANLNGDILDGEEREESDSEEELSLVVNENPICSNYCNLMSIFVGVKGRHDTSC